MSVFVGGESEDVQEQPEVVLVAGAAGGDSGCGGELLLGVGVEGQALGFEGLLPVGDVYAAVLVDRAAVSRR
ncbi:hypothetical protein [Streptomyces sirii]|uniref:hypothetical protein n=1 Tax=Streptomyces sirii TaxID=3127701 RepID=UPI003D3676C8